MESYLKVIALHNNVLLESIGESMSADYKIFNLEARYEPLLQCTKEVPAQASALYCILCIMVL